jgi:hypothetical protein
MATKKNQFITVITDEAMQKICYDGGGWILSPFEFAISETDVLSGIQVLTPEGDVSDEALEKLNSLNTQDMMNDINNSKVWCQLPFSSIMQANSTTLNHHIVIPPDLDVTSNKTIKTIYFKYKNNFNEVFLYAVAYAIDTEDTAGITYEIGVTQSFFFTFTVTNASVGENVKFKVNYVYPQDIDDHNYNEDVHENLLKRDGSRSVTGNYLAYNSDRDFSRAGNYALVTKGYVDSLINILKQNNNLI